MTLLLVVYCFATGCEDDEDNNLPNTAFEWAVSKERAKALPLGRHFYTAQLMGIIGPNTWAAIIIPSQTSVSLGVESTRGDTGIKIYDNANDTYFVAKRGRVETKIINNTSTSEIKTVYISLTTFVDPSLGPHAAEHHIGPSEGYVDLRMD